MSQALLARVEDCYQLAEQFFKKSFIRPDVSLRLRGQKAGVAHLQENRLRFNEVLYRQNQEHFLKHTVAHEVAHLVAHQLFGSRISPHGKEWQLIMQGVYGLPPSRCHTYAIERPARKVYLYRCGCSESPFSFTARRHGLVKKGYRYSCRRCQSPLTYTGQTRLDNE
ncbi:SprT family zinc-dependent metalloprotease [Pseudomonas luteola]|uniref:SprT family zinc-dependent metalloprotease n=1 Tax=Pseudomonas TaxID=286 RepID=UPI000314C502|nr:MULTISPECIES: SprT family zinc-dependent metalloprotease [Pseudomonas]AYN94277.1 SprT family zinc-dependent metalloprotease [Pseudomonas sp. LTJR-52]MDN3237513.1 SprT family zinc-dependent metalloprotease [Pseudomonas sp. WAC2]RRW40738.1 SprT family zinc-dependent metalloprotease [Pseudomonas luteola]